MHCEAALESLAFALNGLSLALPSDASAAQNAIDAIRNFLATNDPFIDQHIIALIQVQLGFCLDRLEKITGDKMLRKQSFAAYSEALVSLDKREDALLIQTIEQKIGKDKTSVSKKSTDELHPPSTYVKSPKSYTPAYGRGF